MLQLDEIHTYYGESHVLHGVSLEVKKGSVVGIIGRNGMGKTTLIRSVIGFNPPRQGKVVFKGKDIAGLPPHKIAVQGMGLVPQGRRIFPSLSVEENLLMSARKRFKGMNWDLNNIYSLFPVLKQRAHSSGGHLSGGEQQMLAIGRALMTNSEFLLMDEPSEGLAPKIVEEISEVIKEIKKEGFSILLVEQNLSVALELADYIYIMKKGEISYEFPVEALNDRCEIMNYF